MNDTAHYRGVTRHILALRGGGLRGNRGPYARKGGPYARKGGGLRGVFTWHLRFFLSYILVILYTNSNIYSQGPIPIGYGDSPPNLNPLPHFLGGGGE